MTPTPTQATPPTQTALPGMPMRLFGCTPTRLLSWLDCPRRYRFAYLDRPPPPKGPPWAHNSVGAAVHSALAGWWRLPVTDRTPFRAGELVAQCWLGEGFRDEAQSLAARDRAVAMVERYAAGLDPHEEPLGVERTVGARTSVLALSGRVDRIDLREGGAAGDPELVVVDYKTGRHLLSTDDARTSLALALYALAASATLRRPCRRVELHHLPSGQVLAFEHSEESLDRHLRRAESLAGEARAAEAAYRSGLSDDEADEWFAARPRPACGWCDYLGSCPSGQAGAVARRPWDGLPDGG